MKIKVISLFIFCFFVSIDLHSQSQTILFDSDWKFHRGGAQGAETKEFDDSSWRTIDLPHDWSIEDLPGTNSPFNRDAISQVSGGFTTGGTGWYRKTFVATEQQKDKRIIIEFEGAYMNPEIWNPLWRRLIKRFPLIPKTQRRISITQRYSRNRAIPQNQKSITRTQSG